ncbi:MAG: putative outer membrane protein involved in nutrient binding [Mucilaginibacter sp.]|nr:putative outer membrane protein involved in nutrient binding [Mucilaginibacter sp.]
MNKLYLLRSLLIGTMLAAAAGQLMAQTNRATTFSDSSAIKAGKSSEMVPGRLFNSDRINSTGAVSTVSGETLYHTPTPNITNTLYGRLPGLTVGQGSGEPGYDNANLGIRGMGTYGVGTNTNGYNTFKIFVDGFEVNENYFSYLAPAEVESISILKDAASLATFGMRGANGVIWVVTKRGKIGRPTIQFQTRTGFQSPENINKPLNSYGYATLYNEAVSNDNGNIWTPKYTAAQLQGYQNGTGTNVDWYKQVLKNHTPYTDGDLIFNGGDTAARYNVVFDYANQQGLYNAGNTDVTSNQMLSRYNLRTNLNFSMFSIFEARVDLGGRLEDRRMPNYPVNGNASNGALNYSTANIFNDLANYPDNIYPPTVNGQLSGTALYPNNPLGSISGLGFLTTHTKVLQGNFGLKEKLDFITKGLYMDEAVSFNSYSVSSYNKTATYARYFNGATTTTDKTTPIVATTESPVLQENWEQATYSIGYDRQFGDHHVISAVNYDQSDFRGDGQFGYIYHYQDISGKANYTYKNRYVGEFGFSYFGTDSYAPGNRWGFYPAISGAWIISNESFLQANPVLSFFKLRASVGKTGSSDSQSVGNTIGSFSSNGRFLYQQYYTGATSTTGLFYQGNGTPTQAGILNPLFIANPGIFAEQSIKYNIGTDLTLFKRLNVTLDAFMDKRSDIITLDNSIPGDFGNNLIFRNVGKMTNKGFEASATYSNKSGQVGYTITGMASYNKNRIDYEAEVPTAYPYNAQTGRPLGTPIGLEATGFYQLSDFNADGSLRSGEAVPAFGKVQPGDIKYKDLNGDGKIDQTDVTATGKSPFPTLTYSFGGNLNYKGFDVGVFFQGTSGSSVNILYANSTSTTLNPQTVAFVNNGNVYSIAQGAWAYYPDQGIDTRATANYPRLTTTGNNNNYRPSTFWMKSGDYLRIRNAELGYTFSSDLIRRLKLSKLRIYVNAVNPVTWSSLLKNYHMDPETYSSGYPALKSVNMGLTATF